MSIIRFGDGQLQKVIMPRLSWVCCTRLPIFKTTC